MSDCQGTGTPRPMCWRPPPAMLAGGQMGCLEACCFSRRDNWHSIPGPHAQQASVPPLRCLAREKGVGEREGCLSSKWKETGHHFLKTLRASGEAGLLVIVKALRLHYYSPIAPSPWTQQMPSRLSQVLSLQLDGTHFPQHQKRWLPTMKY